MPAFCMHGFEGQNPWHTIKLYFNILMRANENILLKRAHKSRKLKYNIFFLNKCNVFETPAPKLELFKNLKSACAPRNSTPLNYISTF